MKKATILLIFWVFVLLCGCGKLPETGPYGTIDSASMAAERDGILYFLDPVGCVFENTGVSAYDTATGEYRTEVTLEEDVYSFQLAEDTILVRTDAEIYAINGETSSLLYQETEEDWTLDWMFLLERDIYFCRSTFWWDENEELFQCVQILSMPSEGGKPTVVAELTDYAFAHEAITCYYDGKLYSRGYHGEIFALDLNTGEVESFMAPDFVSEIFSLEDGVFYTMTDEAGTNTYRLDGTVWASDIQGELLGANEDTIYLFSRKYVSGKIYAQSGGISALVYDDFEWDMVTEPVGFGAGD